jgi:CO/xanthine dehydrogenase FAD-binding subunit
MVAVVVEIDDHIVQRACVAVGSCSAVACRVPHLEFALTGKPLDGNFPAIARREHFELLAPIDDVRASAAYRMDATLTLVRRALASLLR